MKKLRSIALLFCSLVVLVSCAGLHGNTSPCDKQCRIFLYMSCPSELSVNISFVVSDLRFMKEDGEWIDVVLDRTIDSADLSGEQMKLSEFCLPSGTYRQMKWKIVEAKKRRKGKVFSLALPEPGGEHVQDVDFVVFDNESSAFFVDWNPEKSVVEKYLFQPKMVIRTQRNDIKNDLLYVTNSGSDSVLVVHREYDKVVGAIAVEHAPKGIVASPDGRMIYVANSGSNSISVIDPGINRVTTTMSTFTYDPAELAISDDGRWLFATSPDSDNVLVIDTVSNMLTTVIPVGHDPGAIVFDGRRDRLYVVNRGEDSVSVIDVNTSSVESTVSVGLHPTGLAIFEDKLYVVNSDSSSLLVIDIPSYTIEKTISVPQRPVWVQPGLSGRLYLSSAGINEISFIHPLLGMVLKDIPVGNLPGHMAVDSLRRKLYVVNRLSDDISVVDLLVEKVTGVIQVGKNPYGIAIIEQ